LKELISNRPRKANPNNGSFIFSDIPLSTLNNPTTVVSQFTNRETERNTEIKNNSAFNNTMHFEESKSSL
jgi:hypothetical protein